MNDYIEMFSISPTKVVSMYRKKSTLFRERNEQSTEKNESKNKIVRKYHNFRISENSQRNLRKKIEYLFQFSTEKKVKSRNNKIFKYKCAFMTFTLSSQQIHCTAEIVNKIWQPFLDRMRKLHGMNNYVYRLEFQRNKNVHFHLVTDCYVDYYDLLKLWNECQDYRLYHLRYVNERANESYSEFLNKKMGSNKSKNELFNEWVKNKQGLAVANSVDVRVARDNTDIGSYISKYFSKKNGSDNSVCNDLDNEENSFGLRLCFWSRSLSQCKSELMPEEYYPYNNIFEKIRGWNDVVEKWFDYCKVLYINRKKLFWNERDLLNRIFDYFKRKWGYQEWNSSNCIYVLN